MSISEKNIEKLEGLAYMVAILDGISEEEGLELEMFAGKLRGFYPFRKAVEVYEKSGDIDKAMTHVDGPPIMSHIMQFGLPEHLREIKNELDGMIENSENPLDDYDALLKIKASEINDEFDQKMALMFIEDTISEDGLSEIEMRALLTLSRFWGISRAQVNIWYNDYFDPILKRANKLEYNF